MAIDEPCPACGGTEYVLLSPGLHRCIHLVRWTVRELVTEYVTVDDPGAFYNMGLRGTTTAAQQRWVDVEKSRVCDNEYEVDTPMTGTPCQLGPEGKSCGAFAVGFCSDCSKAVCRHHGMYFEDRLVCGGCKATITTARKQAAATRLAADQAAEAARQQATEAEAARAVQAERDTALAAGESLDPKIAARQYIAALLAELAKKGYPGLDAYTMPAKGRFSRSKAIPCYYLDTVKGSKGYTRGDPYEPLVKLYVTLDGQLISDGTPARQWADEEIAVHLHTRGLEYRVDIPVPYALRTLRGYNFFKLRG